MKTTKTIAALSLALIFAVMSSFAGNNVGGKLPPAASMIRHLVTIPSYNEVPMSCVYAVEIRNENGQLVAPPQIFVAGTSQYIFQERAFVGEGVRIATMRLMVNNDPWVNDTELTVEPFIIKGIFEAGKTYRYFLSPKLETGKE